MGAAWMRETWIAAAIFAASLFLGLFMGHPMRLFAGGLILYLLINLRQLHRLRRWLLNKKQDDVPDAVGVWGEVFNEIRKLERETQRRKDRLEGMLERFQSASEVIPDAMVILSTQDEIEWANPAAERLLGLRWPRDHGARIANLIRNPEFLTYMRRGDYHEAMSLPSPAVSGIKLSAQIVPFGSSQRLVIARDVTHLAKLEEMRRNFVANVSHELRTPVTVLLGFLEMMRDNSEMAPDDLHAAFGTMHEQAERMRRLVDDLLTLSRLETTPAHVHEEPTDVAALLESTKSVGELLSNGQHRFVLQADRALRLIGNQEELRSAFSNLVNNAVRHTPAGGEVRLRWWRDDEGAKFSVSDTGEGIAPQHIPRLTERFYRVDSGRSRATGGTGLGLSIVKHVLLRHEARLTIDSEIGKGSTFTCVFPPARIVARDTAASLVSSP